MAWVDSDGYVRVADVDGSVLEWRSPSRVPAGTRALSWSVDGRRLIAAGRRDAALYAPGAAAVRRIHVRGRLVAAAFPPGSGPPALLERRNNRSSLRLLGRAEPLIETSGRYNGLVWSPDGRWLLTRWGERWLLVRRDGRSVTTTGGNAVPLAWTP